MLQRLQEFNEQNSGKWLNGANTPQPEWKYCWPPGRKQADKTRQLQTRATTAHGKGKSSEEESQAHSTDLGVTVYSQALKPNECWLPGWISTLFGTLVAPSFIPFSAFCMGMSGTIILGLSYHYIWEPRPCSLGAQGHRWRAIVPQESYPSPHPNVR